MIRQLTLDLPVRAAHGRDDFFAAPSNADALAAIEGWRNWPDKRMLLVGPKGSGKSHLVQVWAEACPAARSLAATDLPGTDIPTLAAGPLAVEDCGALAGDLVGETALFHLYNLMGAQGQTLLLTAEQGPGLWPTVLPDLASRLQAMPVVRLDPPCDALLSAVLVKLFADRQIAVAPTLITWLLPRIERSLLAAATVVARLDAAALAAGRAVTVPLAAQVLDTAGTDGQDGTPKRPGAP